MFSLFNGNPSDFEPDFSTLGDSVLKWLKAIVVGVVLVVIMTFSLIIGW